MSQLKTLFELKVVARNEIFKSKNELNPLFQKLFLTALAMGFQNEDLFKEPIPIHIGTFIKSCKSSQDAYSRIKDQCTGIVENLYLTIEEWVDTKDGKKREYHVIPYVGRLTYKEENSTLYIKFTQDIIPYFIDFKKHFTQFKLGQVLNLNSTYSIKLYELLRCECQNFKKLTFKIRIEDLRFYFGLEKNQLRNFSDFNRRALMPPKKEINEKTDLCFDYKPIKKGRKVVEIAFEVWEKGYEQEDVTDVDIIEHTETLNKNTTNNSTQEKIELRTALMDLKINKNKIDELLTNYEEKYLWFVLEKSKIKTRSKVDNKAGYFLTCVEAYEDIWEDLKEAKLREEKNRHEYEQAKQKQEAEEKHRQQRWESLQQEIARDLLEEDPTLFAKAVIKHLHTFVVSLKGGASVYSPNYIENYKNGTTQINKDKTKEVYQQVMNCKNMREIIQLVKYEENWLFKAVCNQISKYNWNTNQYDYSEYTRIKKEILPEWLT